MPKKILLVDDEENIVTMVEARLVANGYDVISSFDGQDALVKARSENPDLVILDTMLPKLNGFAVCRILKADDQMKHIPVVLFSARVDVADFETGKEQGADAYITKPFRSEMFLGKISELFKTADGCGDV
jgi:DNA-binding response OmpR family regulator